MYFVFVLFSLKNFYDGRQLRQSTDHTNPAATSSVSFVQLHIKLDYSQKKRYCQCLKRNDFILVKMVITMWCTLFIAAIQLKEISGFQLSKINQIHATRSFTAENLQTRYPFKLSVSLDDDLTLESASSDDDGERKLKPVRRLKRNKKKPLIAILGRPNVGKSALVNRIAGTQSGGAIVADESGITRDRTYRPAEFLGESFQLVDTGGLVFDDNDALFAKEIREQAMIAIEEASGVILVVDGQVGLTNMDQELADFLRKQISKDIPVHVAVNKCESEKNGAVSTAEFWSLGLGEPFAVSALHGVGTAELLEAMFESIDKKGSAFAGFGTKAKKLAEAKEKIKISPRKKIKGETEEEALLRMYGIQKTEELVAAEYEKAMAAFDDEEDPEEIGIAIIGRPNVGKSSLLNSLFGSTRAIVSDMAGTTRDSIDAVMERPPPEGSDELPTVYRFIDTAGIRRKGKIDFGPEFFMVNRALRAIRRADVGKCKLHYCLYLVIFV